MKLKAMIIDDEFFVRDDLRHLLSFQDEIEVVCEAGTISEAKKLLSENSIDVVFLDIQLRGGSGFELLPFIGQATEIIFITAFDAYAVRAFEVNALDYILKPVTPDRLSQSIERLTSGKTAEKAGPSNTGPFKPDDRVLITTDSGKSFIDLEEILVISTIGGNYAALNLKNGKNVVSRKTLKEWEKLLPESVFIRIHRSTIINLKYLDRIFYDKDGSCLVTLSGFKDTFPVSRRMMPKLKSIIDTLSS